MNEKSAAKTSVSLTTASLLLILSLRLCAAAVPTETDTRLHADGKGWRLDKAKVVDPQRPRVLLIGDSILNGYQKQATAALDGKAYVDAWVNPYNQSEHLNKLLAEVLAEGPYDVVHFNMGLHGWQEGRIKPGTFEPLTRAYVQVIKDKLPKAKIIWACSTPVTAKGQPTELDPVINPVIIEHNRLAAKVMAEQHVPVNDFYALLVERRDLARGDQFHWTAPAYELLAKTVTESVLRELAAPKPATAKTEPTNAKESTAQKAAADKLLDEQYAALLAKLPPEQRAWEEVLQQNLGSFYLPIHKREKVAGKSNAWDFVADDPKLPRVLLIGDSVSRGYTQAVRSGRTARPAHTLSAGGCCGMVQLSCASNTACVGSGWVMRGRHIRRPSRNSNHTSTSAMRPS